MAGEGLASDMSVVVFGSWARDELTDYSDDDWAVLVGRAFADYDAALAGLATREGHIVARDGREQPLPVEPWLDQAGTPDSARRKIREALERELAGGRPTGMRPRVTARGLAVVQRWELLVVRRGEPAAGRPGGPVR